MDIISTESICQLTRDFCQFATGVVSPENERLFELLKRELPLKMYRYPSGATWNGWEVPKLWRVSQARISCNGEMVFDATRHPLGVATYSRSFQGELELDELLPHLVTNARLPHAYVYHCMWQYRPWSADWAISMPHEIYRDLRPGRYHVDLQTNYEDGEMLVGEYEHPGQSKQTIVFNCHTCHPCMANDAFAGVAILVRLFQWLGTRRTHYTYRLVLGPEHLGTVFYLRDKSRSELENLVCGVFPEMPGTDGPLRVTSTFLGHQPIDKAFRTVVRHHSQGYNLVPWRCGAGNDETVWEAPGYEVPFVEITRCRDSNHPYPEYHTSADTADLMRPELITEFYEVLQRVINVLEQDAVMFREFDGLICLSNPKHNLYFERHDPAVKKEINDESEKWGHLLDSLFRYFDGSMSILDIAEKHELPFEELHRYLLRFQEKGLIVLKPHPIQRPPISQRYAKESPAPLESSAAPHAD